MLRAQELPLMKLHYQYEISYLFFRVEQEIL